MGCDIHMYVEYKKELPNKQDMKKRMVEWVSGDYFSLNPYFGRWDNEEEYSHAPIYRDRNYSLFSTLAGVRDYSEKVIPVHEPKGVPLDCCEYVRKMEDVWDGDGHSHSWLTLKELKEYQAKQPTLPRSGLINQSQIKDLENGIFPNSWCQGTNVQGYERREWVEENNTLVPLIALIEERLESLSYNVYHEEGTDKDENIRIVFWFDN